MNTFEELLALYESLGFVANLIEIAIAVLTIVSMWKVFVKAGERGWKIFIPIYGTYIHYKIAGCKGRFWLILVLGIAASCLGGYGAFALLSTMSPSDAAAICLIATAVLSLIVFFLAISLNFKMAKAFGRSWFFGLGLLFLPFIFYCILAFNSNIVYSFQRD